MDHGYDTDTSPVYCAKSASPTLSQADSCYDFSTLFSSAAEFPETKQKFSAVYTPKDPLYHISLFRLLAVYYITTSL